MRVRIRGIAICWYLFLAHYGYPPFSKNIIDFCVQDTQCLHSTNRWDQRSESMYHVVVVADELQAQDLLAVPVLGLGLGAVWRGPRAGAARQQETQTVVRLLQVGFFIWCSIVCSSFAPFFFFGCCKTTGKLWQHITETLYGVFLLVLFSFDCQIWAIFHFGTLWLWKWTYFLKI